MSLWDAFCSFCGVVVAVSLVLYALPLIILSLVPRFRTQNLLAKYGDWAVVTGGTSGIGLSIARKLAAQRINVCVVALEDKLFEPSIAALRSGFPAVEIRAVPVNLAEEPALYMRAIENSTNELSQDANARRKCFIHRKAFVHSVCTLTRKQLLVHSSHLTVFR